MLVNDPGAIAAAQRSIHRAVQQGAIDSQARLRTCGCPGGCNPSANPVNGQGIGIVNAFDNGNAGVCASPSSGIMLILSGGARNSGNSGWSLADVQDHISVSVNGSSTPLVPLALGDSDTPVPDNYYEICVNYPSGASFADVTNIQVDSATAYDPHGCANDGTKSWKP